MKEKATTDGISNKHWAKIREFAIEFPKPVQRLNKIPYLTDYYLQPLAEEFGKYYPAYKSMQPERAISIGYKIYSNPKNPIEKEKAVAFLKTLIFDYKHLF